MIMYGDNNNCCKSQKPASISDYLLAPDLDKLELPGLRGVSTPEQGEQ